MDIDRKSYSSCLEVGNYINPICDFLAGVCLAGTSWQAGPWLGSSRYLFTNGADVARRQGVILMVARTRRFTHAVGSPFLECGVTCSASLNLQAFSTPQHTRVLCECNRRRPGIAWNTFHMPMPLSGQLGRPRSIQIVQLAYRLCSCNNMATWHWGTSVLHSPTITTIRGILWVHVCIRGVIP